MVFEHGTATSTLDLYNKLRAFMTTVPGWQLWSNFDGYSSPDKVYYSTGTTGRNAIYIRQRIAPAQPYLNEQVDYYNYDGYGDTGYLVFNAYVNFPQNGNKTSGISEIGNVGPRMLYAAFNTNYTMYHQDFLSQKPGGASHAVYGSVLGEDDPPNDYPDYRCATQRRWTQMTGPPTDGDPYSGRQWVMATDGVGNIYMQATQTYSQKFYRYSLKRAGGKIDAFGLGTSNATLLYDFGGTGFSPRYMVYAEDRATRTPYLYFWSDNSSNGGKKYNLNTGTFTSISAFSWPSRGSPATSYGQGDSRAACWDGKRYIYLVRGGVYYHAEGGGGNGSTPDWARYDTVTGAYRITTSPEDPEFHGIELTWGGGTTGIVGRAHLTYLPKEVSGFTYNRLCFAIGGGDAGQGIYYIEIGDNGLPVPANPWWTFQTTISAWEYYNTGKMIYTRDKKIILAPYNMYGINGKYERFPGGQQMIRPITIMNMSEPPGQKSDIRAIDCHYFPERGEGNYVDVLFLDGYSCRTRTSVNGNTDYMFIGDADRIIVATKAYPYKGSAGIATWSVAYMGAFNSAYNSEPYAEIDEDLYAGAHKKVKLKNVHGSFDPLQTYAIVDVNSEGIFYKYNFADNRIRKIANSEIITVFSFDGDSAVISAKNDYKKGAKIGYDPQPVGLFIWEQEKFQATNVGNRMSDDTNGCNDPSKQTYTVTSMDNVLSSGVAQAMLYNQPLTIMDYPIMCTDSEGNTIVREVRGNMKGIYVMGKASGISSEQTISIGDKSYIVLDLPEYGKYVLIGPIKE